MATGYDVCLICGWAAHGPYSVNKCDSVAGEIGSRLMMAVATTPSTKLGYGYRQVVFEPDDNFHIRFEVGYHHALSLRDVWLLDDLTHDDALDLVQTLAEWRKRRRNAKET